METNDKLLEIIKQLNDNRNKLSALFSLYNSSLLIAEDSRANLTNYFEQLIDHKNDLSTITRDISSASKAERAGVYTKNKSKINRLNTEVQQVNADFSNSCKKYRVALQDCGSLKTEYKHEVSQLCKDFKANVDEETPAIVIKGYKQQIKIIKAILDKIEMLVSDYNVKKNKLEEDNVRFNELYSSVNTLINQLKQTA